MENLRMEFPEVIGKTVAGISVLQDPEDGRELLVRFTDATQLSIAIGVRQTIDAQYCREDEPDQPLFVRQDL